VFMQMNSTPLMPSRTMRVMAFDPPPPQPIALILAGAVENIDFDILYLSLLLFGKY
jgi:hypothetical protein